MSESKASAEIPAELRVPAPAQQGGNGGVVRGNPPPEPPEGNRKSIDQINKEAAAIYTERAKVVDKAVVAIEKILAGVPVGTSPAQVLAKIDRKRVNRALAAVRAKSK